jgi:hypothetical protein
MLYRARFFCIRAELENAKNDEDKRDLQADLDSLQRDYMALNKNTGSK